MTIIDRPTSTNVAADHAPRPEPHLVEDAPPDPDRPLYQPLAALIADPQPQSRQLLAALLARCFPGLRIHASPLDTDPHTRPDTDRAARMDACFVALGHDAARTHPDHAAAHVETAQRFREQHPGAALIACLSAPGDRHADVLERAGCDLVCRHDTPGDLPRAIRHLQRVFEQRLLGRAGTPAIQP